MRYAQATAAAAKAPPLVVRGLKPSAWADTWDEKAKAPVDVGVRHVSEADLKKAREHGAKIAREAHSDLDERSVIWAETYNQAVMHYVLGCALCQPGDVSEPLFEMQEFTISSKLSKGGTLRLWDAVEELGIVDSPLSPEIDGDGIELLAANLRDDAWWNRMPARDRRMVSRLLQRALDIASST